MSATDFPEPAAKSIADAEWPEPERLRPTDDNPLAMAPHIFTIVTSDVEASIDFYTTVMGLEIIDRGELSFVPDLSTAGPVGRPYALLRHRETPLLERGVIRLLLAPDGAKANRPRPEAKITDPGLAVFEFHPSDDQRAYRHMTDAGVPTVSPPQYYFFGPDRQPWSSSTTFSVFGSAGEQMFLSCQNVPNSFGRKRPVSYEGLFGPPAQHTLMTNDRWPMMDFYVGLFGLKQLLDWRVAQESINTLIGAPVGTAYQFLWVGGAEIWEFRHVRPAVAPPWPTDLDRTGLAMVTLLVDDLDLVRERAIAAHIAILAEGGLPSPTGSTREAVFVRGPVGELLEIVGRS